MASLADRIRAAREQWVTAGGKQWLVRRPTSLQIHSTREGDAVQLVLQSVVGWKMPEHEIVPGGGGAVPAFDADAFREWVEDRPQVLTELADALKAMIKAHAEAEQAAEKN